jgi:hypothetical protein
MVPPVVVTLEIPSHDELVLGEQYCAMASMFNNNAEAKIATTP